MSITIDTKQEVAKMLLEAGVVTLSPQDPYRFSSGILSPIYSDHRQILGYPAIRKRVAHLLSEAIRSLGTFDVVAGTATAAIAHGAWVADIMELPFVYVRSKPKEHGKKSQVEGKLEKNQRVVIVEDLVSTGQSAITSALAIRSEDCQSNDIVAITTYNLAVVGKNMKENKLQLHTLTDFETIIDVACEIGRMNASDRELVMAWQADPEAWSGQ